MTCINTNVIKFTKQKQNLTKKNQCLVQIPHTAINAMWHHRPSFIPIHTQYLAHMALVCIFSCHLSVVISHEMLMHSKKKTLFSIFLYSSIYATKSVAKVMFSPQLSNSNHLNRTNNLIYVCCQFQFTGVISAWCFVFFILKIRVYFINVFLLIMKIVHLKNITIAKIQHDLNNAYIFWENNNLNFENLP